MLLQHVSAAPAQVRGGQEARRLSVARRLLVGVGDAKELRFGEGATVEAYADGQAVDVARGDLYVRVAGDRGGRGTAAGEVVAVQKVCRPSGAARGRDDGVEVVFPYHCVQPLRLRERLACLESLEVCGVCERALGLGLREKLLTEEGHLPVAVLLVEVNQVFERARVVARGERGEILVDVCLELEEQNVELRRVYLAVRREVCRVNHGRALALHKVNRVAHQLVNLIVEAEEFSRHSDARAAKPRGVERLSVVGRLVRRTAAPLYGVARVWGGERG